MTKGNWITITLFVIGIVGSALTLAYKVGTVASAVDQNTGAIYELKKEIDQLDHAWSTRRQEVERRIDGLDHRLTRVETRMGLEVTQ